MKKILVIGCSGFIGSSLVSHLAKTNEVWGLSRTNIKNIQNWASIDLTNKEEVLSFFNQNQFDVIIHLAFILANQENAKDIKTYDQNITIHKNILNGLKEHKPCHFVYFSSSAVYPNVSGTFAETDEINPSENSDSLYGLAKFNGEILFKTLLRKEIDQLHLRVGFVYGEGMDETRIHSKFKAELNLENTITVFGNGIRTLPQIEVMSLCDKISYFVKNNIKGTYNLADENISLESLAQRFITEEGNHESKIVYKEVGNRNVFQLNLNKLKNLYND